MTPGETVSPPVSRGVLGGGPDCSASLQVQALCLGLAASQASCPALVVSPAWCPASEVSPGWQVTVPRSPVPTTWLCGGHGGWWLRVPLSFISRSWDAGSSSKGSSKGS